MYIGVPDNVQQRKVQVRIRTVIPSISKATMKIRTSASGLRLIKQHGGSKLKQFISWADGLMEVIPDEPFTILVSTLIDPERRFPNLVTISRVEPPPNYYILILEIICAKAPPKQSPQSSMISFVLASEDLPAFSSMSRNLKRKRSTTFRTGIKQIQISSVFEDRRDEVLQVLEPSLKIWDGRLSQMFGVEHHIDQMPDA